MGHKQSGFLAAEKQRRKILLEQCQHIERQRCFDCFQIAMRRKGYSYTKIKEVSMVFMDVVDEFAGAFQGDIDPEADYLRVMMDKALSEFIAPHQRFLPFDERYPDLRSIDSVTGRLGK